MEKGLEKVLKGISVDFNLNMWCDGCPYKYRVNCKEDLRDDILKIIEWLNYENKVLRHNVIDLTKESEQLKRENKRLLENKR
jgi:hypothetical protein